MWAYIPGPADTGPAMAAAQSTGQKTPLAQPSTPPGPGTALLGEPGVPDTDKGWGCVPTGSEQTAGERKGRGMGSPRPSPNLGARWAGEPLPAGIRVQKRRPREAKAQEVGQHAGHSRRIRTRILCGHLGVSGPRRTQRRRLCHALSWLTGGHPGSFPTTARSPYFREHWRQTGVGSWGLLLTQGLGKGTPPMPPPNSPALSVPWGRGEALRRLCHPNRAHFTEGKSRQKPFSGG